MLKTKLFLETASLCAGPFAAGLKYAHEQIGGAGVGGSVLA